MLLRLTSYSFMLKLVMYISSFSIHASLFQTWQIVSSSSLQATSWKSNSFKLISKENAKISTFAACFGRAEFSKETCASGYWGIRQLNLSGSLLTKQEQWKPFLSILSESDCRFFGVVISWEANCKYDSGVWLPFKIRGSSPIYCPLLCT